MNDTNLRRTLLPLQPAFTAVGDSKSQGYANIKGGLFPKPVKRGRTSLIPSDELQAVIDARVAGLGDDQIRALVTRLHAARQQPAATPAGQ